MAPNTRSADMLKAKKAGLSPVPKAGFMMPPGAKKSQTKPKPAAKPKKPAPKYTKAQASASRELAAAAKTLMQLSKKLKK